MPDVGRILRLSALVPGGPMAPRIVLRGLSDPIKGQTWELGGVGRRGASSLHVGRLDVLDVVLSDPSVSHYHAEIKWTDRGWMVRDQGSTNGTFLNGARVTGRPRPLRRRDVIQFGAVALLVEAANEPAAPDRLATATGPWSGVTVVQRVVLRGLNGPTKGKAWAGAWLLRIGGFAPVTVDLEDHSVSRLHAEVRFTEGQGWSLEDLGSSTGTFLNGVRLGGGPHPLKQGDIIRVGAVEIAVEEATDEVIVRTAQERLADARVPAERAAILKETPLSPRKLRLFACACCRGEGGRDGHAFEDGAVEVAERYADGKATGEELERAHRQVGRDLRSMAHVATSRGVVPLDRYDTVDWFNTPEAHLNCLPTLPPYPPWCDEYLPVLEDLVGPPPFGPVPVAPRCLAWGDGLVVKLAQSIYEGRAFGDMPVLGDALEDAGCEEEAILRHCRGPGRHWCGCWVIDLLTGRA